MYLASFSGDICEISVTDDCRRCFFNLSGDDVFFLATPSLGVGINAGEEVEVVVVVVVVVEVGASCASSTLVAVATGRFKTSSSSNIINEAMALCCGSRSVVLSVELS